MIHHFSLGGFHIVLDVCSGSVHVTDEAAAEAIRLSETLPEAAVRERILAKFTDSVTPREVDECLDGIAGLRREGKLYAPEVFPEAFRRGGGATGEVKALCLHVAHTCNLDCSYCFASQGRYRGRRALMDAETGRQAVDFLVRSSGEKRSLDIDFFGGEPLMNWETVREVVRYARSLEKGSGKRFRFTLTTNGLLLDDEVTAFCNGEMHNVVLSLDGRREVHDRFRRDLSGRGSYDRVVPRFQRFVQKRGSGTYYVRGTYTRYNLDFLNDLLHMADLGFTQLSMEPVVADPEDPCALRREDLPVLYGQYEKLAEEMLRRSRAGEKELVFYHFMLDLEHGPCAYKRLSGCGAGRDYLAVTPWGDLYPCHQFVGNPRFLLGDLKRGVTDEALRGEFAPGPFWQREECAVCWARYHCAGACTANAYNASGDLHGLYPLGCDLFRKRLECAIMLKAAEAADRAEAAIGTA